MKLRIVKNILTEASRKNIVDTLTNKVKRALARFFVENELDPSNTEGYTIDLSKTMGDLANVSKKFKSPVTKIVIKHTPRWPKPEDTAYYSGNMIFVYIPFGYDGEDFKDYLALKKKKPDQAKFEEAVDKQIEKNKASKSYKSNQRPKFSLAASVNKFNLEQVKKDFPIYKNAEEANERMSRCKPNSPERNKYIYAALGKTTDAFSTLFHEMAHGKQYNVTGREKELFKKPDTDMSHRVLQLNTHFLDENLPSMSMNNYVSNIAAFQLDPGSRETALGKFFYFSRPLEIDARLKEERLFYRNKRKESPETAAEELFDHVKKREERYASTIQVSAYFKTDEAATEELRNKYLHQYYHQMSVDAKDLFSLNPKFQEELEKYKTKVEEINNKIKMNPNVANTADERQKMKYRSYSSRDPSDNPPEETSQT